MRSILGWDNATSLVVDADRYGFGGRRPARLFFQLFGIDGHQNRVLADICKGVSHGDMHRALTPFQHGNGIDYTAVVQRFGEKVRVDHLYPGERL